MSPALSRRGGIALGIAPFGLAFLHSGLTAGALQYGVKFFPDIDTEQKTCYNYTQKAEKTGDLSH